MGTIFKKVIIVIAALASTSAMGYHLVQDAHAGSDTKKERYEYYYNKEAQSEDGTVVSPEDLKLAVSAAPLIAVDTDPDSLGVLVNQKYLLPEDYVPADLTVPNVAFSFYGTYEKSYMREVAARALEKLFAGAAEKGYILKGVSAYRSYERQRQIYEKNLATKGRKHTKQFSAKPGSSEHQTGLTIDVSCSAVGCALEESFGETEEGKWLAKNCYKYGFIIRYPKEKSDITKYSYEPWHIRYVGKNLAKYIYTNKLTLEEYYQTTTEDNKVAPDKPIKDTDIGAPDAPEMKAAPTTNPSYKARKTSEPSPKKTKKPKRTEKPKKETKATKKPKKTAKPQTDSDDGGDVQAATPKPKQTEAPVTDKVEEPEETPEAGENQEDKETGDSLKQLETER